MVADQEKYLKEFYGALRDEPLEPDDPKYIDFYEAGELAAADPIQALATTIEWSGESKQLFSGFRGTGKSTELRRLRKKLQAHGNTKVVLCDMEDYLNLTTPVDISDFLISATGAFSDALAADALLGKEMIREGYWTRLENFLTKTNRVDMRIGLDIASLAYKKLVDQIVLVAGDSDFVPAAKLARREGIDFVLDPMWQPIRDDLFEHIDGLRSVCRRPGSHAADPDPSDTAAEATANHSGTPLDIEPVPDP